ncbi:cytochrome c3 family protein [Flavobacterium sp. LS1R49]|uniref:Cytochrome c3 family protein n=1 Tax=Flavobacterium shii TaxID=2987687 RepID=A0A9X2ZIK1_9FLAO|nr:cytochrome c3 family protein [Flavobacterium shii]MCV9929342.1 cytochrome c3 family protein [Flavobacterium shii]
MKNTGAHFILLLLTVFFSSCANKSDEYIDPRGTDYAGSESCIQCHQATYQMALKSAHYKATAPGTRENILGDFDSAKHIFIYDADTKLVMEKRNDSLYQVLYKNGKEVEAHRFDIIFGIKHAQTAAYWDSNYPYELPISYYKSINNWATSPGFSEKEASFSRKIGKECFACHSSNIGSRFITTNSDSINFLSMDVEDFMNEKTLVYGIDCERCHGPAKKHVNYHLKFPNVKTAYAMVLYDTLKRQQKLDACALCHSGNDKLKVKSRFEFRPGDNLLDYFRGVPKSNDTTNYDVHGNQFLLLSQSKCFTKSEAIDCMTCHNPHENAAKSMASYSKICMSCHSIVKHNSATTKSISDNLLKNNCIECHMPKQPSKSIKFQQSGHQTISNYSLRTHRIATYPIRTK